MTTTEQVVEITVRQRVERVLAEPGVTEIERKEFLPSIIFRKKLNKVEARWLAEIEERVL